MTNQEKQIPILITFSWHLASSDQNLFNVKILKRRRALGYFQFPVLKPHKEMKDFFLSIQTER